MEGAYVESRGVEDFGHADDVGKGLVPSGRLASVGQHIGREESTGCVCQEEELPVRAKAGSLTTIKFPPLLAFSPCLLSGDGAWRIHLLGSAENPHTTDHLTTLDAAGKGEFAYENADGQGHGHTQAPHRPFDLQKDGDEAVSLKEAFHLVKAERKWIPLLSVRRMTGSSVLICVGPR